MSDERELTPEERERIERDRQMVAHIRGNPELPEDSAKELFFRHFDWIEAIIRRRLRLHGMSYDAGSEHYNDVFNSVYDRVYAPHAMPNAVRRFDPEKGSLEAWLLGRVVFVVRDWLKSSRGKNTQTTSLESEPAATPCEPPDSEGGQSCLEDGLAEMTAPQRASTVLRLLPARPPTDQDIEVIGEVTERDRQEIKKEIDALGKQFRTESPGVREQRLSDVLALWHMRRMHLRRLHKHYRTELLKSGQNDTMLDALEKRGVGTTQENIRSHYRATKPPGRRSQASHKLQERFELCCRDLARCEQRLEEVYAEYCGAPTTLLLSYDKIADILGSSVTKVNAYLNRARKKIEEVQKRHNATE